MQIEAGKRVRIQVRLQVEDGPILEESVVEYLHGAGKMLVGLEESLEGLTSGDKKEGLIPPEKAFGGPEHQHAKTISKDEFPKDAELKPGTTFVAGGAQGQEIVIEVKAVHDTHIEAILRHTLHDKAIVFAAEVLSVRDKPAAPPPMPSDAIAEDA